MKHFYILFSSQFAIPRLHYSNNSSRPKSYICVSAKKKSHQQACCRQRILDSPAKINSSKGLGDRKKSGTLIGHIAGLQIHPCCHANFSHLCYALKISFDSWMEPYINALYCSDLHIRAIFWSPYFHPQYCTDICFHLGSYVSSESTISMSTGTPFATVHEPLTRR